MGGQPLHEGKTTWASGRKQSDESLLQVQRKATFPNVIDGGGGGDDMLVIVVVVVRLVHVHGVGDF